MADVDYTDFVHTGPGTLAGRYLRRFWQPVYRGRDLEPAQSVPIRMLGENFTLYRGEVPSSESRAPSRGVQLETRNSKPGTPHLVAFRCAHRLTQLSTGTVEGDCIRCLYHGWMYDGSGQCVDQPGEDELFASKVRIRSYPVEEYLGLIFAYLGEGDPPPMRRYPEFEAEPALEVYAPDIWPCNFFNRIDNFCDVGHVAYTHQESSRRRNRPVGIGKITAEETDYGITTVRLEEGELPSRTWVDMPNTNHLGRSAPGARPGDRLFFRVPIDDDSCVSFCVERTHLTGEAARQYLEQRRQTANDAVATSDEVGRAVLAGKLKLRDIDVRTNLSGTGYTDLFWTEDYVAQVGQGTIADRSDERLGRTDVGVILLRKLWQRELKALAEGRPLKQWTTSSGQGLE
jgi:5,5'-dehydrodivanillate O-demethylase oxygenase subunit